MKEFSYDLTLHFLLYENIHRTGTRVNLPRIFNFLFKPKIRFLLSHWKLFYSLQQQHPSNIQHKEKGKLFLFLIFFFILLTFHDQKLKMSRVMNKASNSLLL